ncbi:MAG: DNA repair protein RecO [Gammaproteobacteria bacterium]
MSRREIVDTGYVVHRRRLRETSLTLQLFTREHGRFSVVARGALGSRRRQAATYLEFVVQEFAWSGRADMPTLVRAEPVARPFRLEGMRLFSALYVNELVARFVHRGEANDNYAAYEEVLQALAGDAPLKPALRRFEVRLLEGCGYAMELTIGTDTGEALDDPVDYFYVPEHGPVTRRPTGPHRVVRGATLRALAGERAWDDERLAEAKRLMRFLVSHHLGGQPLTSRTMFMAEAPEDP